MPLRQLFPDPEGTSNDNAKVDIFAIHGLNPRSKKDVDHAWDTWRTPSGADGHLWLRDDLSRYIPEARIFLYEYNATAVYGKDRDTFVGKANELLEAIRIKRTDDTRPILLLGHSMGGLLIKQALINAHNNPKYTPIKDATSGLAFFATPHNGGDWKLVSLGGLAAKIATSAGFQKGDDVLETLKAGSIFSDIMQEHWRHQLLRYDIISFWGSKDGVVPKESARLGLPGDRENVVKLNADHGGVCRFGDSQTDKDNFEVVQRNIIDIYDSAMKNRSSRVWRSDSGAMAAQTPSSSEDSNLHLTEAERKFIEGLPGHDIGSFLDSQEQPQAKSCDWIPKSEEFRNFLSSSETHVLHILGEPGSGKSTAAAWLFRTGSTWGDGLRPQLFSFHGKPRASAAWSSLLYQILHLDGIPSAAVHSALEDEDKSSRWKSEPLSSDPWTFSRLRDVFKSVVCRFPDTLRTLYIIDGLDECDESLVEFVRSIVDILQARTSPGVKFLFLSRQIPSLSLADLFQSAGGTLHIDMNETTAHIENVRSFIKHKVDDLCKSRPGVSQLRSEIIKELENRSAGIYLLASLNIKTLMTAEATPDNIRAVVRTLPDNLQAIYSQALDKVAVAKQPSAAALILWVVFAFRPLRSWELAAAVALTRQASPIPSDRNLEGQVSLDILGGTGIRELVGTLIRVTGGDVISLVHSSAKDYLLSLAPPALNGSPGDHDWVWKWLGNNQDWEHSLTALASQQLSLKCQDLIAFASGTINPSPSPTPTPLDSPNAGIQALLRYAIENLPDHVRQTPPGQNTNAGFAEFLRSDNGTAWTRHFWMLKDPTQPYKQFSPLEFCCALGLVETVKQLLPNDKYPKTQLSDVQGVGRATEDAIELLTAADLAAMFGNVETLRVLCEDMGTPADSDRLIPQTSWKASVEGWVHIGQNYGHYDVPVPAPGTKGEDVANAHQKAVKQLSWYRPLHTAATYGHAAAVDYLISRGASLDREDESRKWPIEIAMENKIEPLVQLLLTHHMDSHLQLLHRLIDVGNLNNIERLVQLHPKFLTNGVDFKTSFGEHSGSILHLSASKGAHPVYQLLTGLGVHPGLEDSEGRQATHYAAASGQSAFLELILADGTASRSAEDVSGRNPLFYATLGASCCDEQKWTPVPKRENTIVALVGDGSRTLSYPLISSALHSLANFSTSSTVLWELVHKSSSAEQFETCVRTLCSKAREITLDNAFCTQLLGQ
ncbi:hypothetical protein NCS55_01435700 [Fusarium keratoplasticum]|nr:hypothetical protein NCS55_01435700 [Fusarium keratoplasticum]